jgi:hypothetical protein
LTTGTVDTVAAVATAELAAAAALTLTSVCGPIAELVAVVAGGVTATDAAGPAT